MKDLTYDVRVYKTYVYAGKKGNTYTVRWRLDREDMLSKVFKRSAQAEVYRSELHAAARKGEAFSKITGEPVSWARTKRAELSWYEFVCKYVDLKWKDASAKYRQDIARAMVAATPPMLIGRPPGTDQEMRSAMKLYAFNTKRRDEAPAEIAERLRWLSANTRPLRDLAIPSVAREVLEAATSNLDGQRSAPDTVRKHRMLLVNAMEYAIELQQLDSNPIKALKWTRPPKTGMREVDRRSVINHSQARALLAAVEKQGLSGPRLVAFFGLMYYAAMRPEEVVNLRHDDVALPAEDDSAAWGLVHLSEAAPHAGRHWTDNGEVRETRALKHREEGETRPVPIPPDLVVILRKHMAEFTDGKEGRLFYGVNNGDEMPTFTYLKVWRQARAAALTEREQASPLAGRPYDLRHACVSTWLNAGVPATNVAEWAGHSVDVLLKIYAKCVEGEDAAAKSRISAALAAGLRG
jgi:integrase